MLAIALVLGCAIVQNPAQQCRAADPPATLWSVLNLPTLERLTKPAKPKPSAAATAGKKRNTGGDEASKKVSAAQPPEPSTNEPTLVSPFSTTNSSRRSAILKREMVRGTSAPPATDFNPPPPSAPPVTPHWIPKFAEQSASLQLADDELARPIAVTMAGELLSERITADRAVARLDATLNVTPAVAHGDRSKSLSTGAAGTGKPASAASTSAAQLATATAAAAR
jgi:hypothetical protein